MKICRILAMTNAQPFGAGTEEIAKAFVPRLADASFRIYAVPNKNKSIKHSASGHKKKKYARHWR